LRKTLDFTWDEKLKTVTLIFDNGIQQLVWE